MTLASHIIDRGLSKAGIKASESPLKASELADGLDVLNDLITDWTANELIEGINPVSSSDTDLNESRFISSALKAWIGKIACSEYGLPLTNELREECNTTMATLCRMKMKGYNPVFPDTLPTGSGNKENTDYEFYTNELSDEENF